METTIHGISIYRLIKAKKYQILSSIIDYKKIEHNVYTATVAFPISQTDYRSISQ